MRDKGNILIIGGAGYLGGTMAYYLLDLGYRVWVVDSLVKGHVELLPRNLSGFTQADMGDAQALRSLFEIQRFDCVLHFGGLIEVGESMKNPALYQENNVRQTEKLLELLISYGSRKLIYASTCSIFENPEGKPIHESFPKKPLNPYGMTKARAEEIIEKFARTKNLQAIIIRTFNAAGADPQGRIGEWHEPETHLIPRVLQAIKVKKSIPVYGSDYPTRDGTCIRDYVHIWDLAQAFEKVIRMLIEKPETGSGSLDAYHLGSGTGFTVKEVIKTCERITGKKIRIEKKPRRKGDPAILVADPTRARQELGFQTAPDMLDRIIRSAWTWETRRAVFLDRDGTINFDPGYINDPDLIQLIPGVGESLAALKQAGFHLIVVSNQSGVGRGLIRLENLIRVNERLNELLRPYGTEIEHFELCLHRPDEHCSCRKPKPDLILNAARKLYINPGLSFMIGDKIADLKAGQAAGCRRTCLVLTGEGETTRKKHKLPPKTLIGKNLAEITKKILSQTSDF